MSSDPERTLHYAVDVTVDDAWAIIDFLTPRLESLERTYDGGTEEHRTAAALGEAMSVLFLALELEIRGPGVRRHRHRSAAPPAIGPSPTEDERIVEKKRRLTRIAEYWNQLCGIVRPWSESKGYDRARWHPVTFLDMAAEDEHHRRVTEAGLRRTHQS
ncbi:hypothetical protein ACFY0B_25615 [Streptomyces sp. NPDC001797]|uniref:hypothetical protein n=1 Tax=Streptomyces sp. NPDC001797 TaxID=3364610 RepID=UPI0036A8278B